MFNNFKFKNNSKTKFRLHSEKGLPSTTFAKESFFNKNICFRKHNVSIAKRLKRESGAGFTLIEIIIVIAVLTVIGAIAITSFISFQKTPQLNNASEEIINILRIAQNKTLSSEGNSQYGVYFDITVSPQQYILFKGSSYPSRNASFDQVYLIPDITEFYAINTGGANEIVFDKLTGSTKNSGNVSLRLKDDNSQTKIIYIDNSGVIGFTVLSIPPDTRVKDSRHIDFDYSRVIDTATESITLTFNGNTIKTIPINQYLSNGQFYWNGIVIVNSKNQTITIHTLRLNSPDTRFSVFRDLRFNDASLTIKISGDNTGTLAEYSADGLTTSFSSIYVNNFAWQ